MKRNRTVTSHVHKRQHQSWGRFSIVLKSFRKGKAVAESQSL